MDKFTSPRQQHIYEMYYRDPPSLSSGNGLIAAYWRGRNDTNVLQHPPYTRTSLAYAAWRAGKKHRVSGIPKSTEPLHPESMRDLRNLVKLHGVAKLQAALRQIEQE